MRERIEPARLAFDADGTPVNARYGDVYASRDGALGQALHVFLGGNALPARWARRGQFVIVETGFGLGMNFLATWRAWRDDPARPRRLHFVSFEKHPPEAANLRRAAPNELAPLAAQLAGRWPLPLPGLHRCEFEGGAVVLTLALGDARDFVPQLVCGADAFYLDGFAPDRNPQMWEPQLLKSLARMARAEATLATWSTARDVRDALAAAGFDIELRAGFGRKRQMLSGRFAPRWRVRRYEPPAAYEGERSALVIGAGLAGSTAARALARRNWRVQVIERAARPASGASALPWGLLYPQITADDSVLARLTRAGFFASRAALAQLAPAGGWEGRPLWQSCGVFKQAHDETELAAWSAADGQEALPTQFAQMCDADAASARLGMRPQRGGWWFPQGALVSAAAWCAASLEHVSIDLRCGQPVDRLRRDADAWQALDALGRVIAAAPVVIVASAFDAPRLLGDPTARVSAVRGRITRVAAMPLAALRAGLTGDGYVVRGPDGWTGIGATYETPMQDDEAMRALGEERAHASNLARLQRLLAQPPSLRVIGGFDAMRCVARDRLPFAGRVVDVDVARNKRDRLRGAHLADLPRLPGLFASYALGSRGLSLAALAAERIAAQIEGEPEPIERDLGAAIDPARESLRLLRRGALR